MIGIFVALNFTSEDTGIDLDEEILTETEDLISGDVGSPNEFKGSCELITQASTCVEYYGSYWNEETITLACSEGLVYFDRCPIPNLGGCRIMPGTETDMITWHYDHGGDPYTQENIYYAAQACNSVPGGMWAEED